MIDKTIVDFTIAYFQTCTDIKNKVTNQDLDRQIQNAVGTRPLTEGGIRALIHHIRVHHSIKNDSGSEGWICGCTDGYYLSYNGFDIITHLNQFEGKIRKMMVVHKRGMETLKNKMYHIQQEFDFNKKADEKH